MEKTLQHFVDKSVKALSKAKEREAGNTARLEARIEVLKNKHINLSADKKELIRLGHLLSLQRRENRRLKRLDPEVEGRYNFDKYLKHKN